MEVLKVFAWWSNTKIISHPTGNQVDSWHCPIIVALKRLFTRLSWWICWHEAVVPPIRVTRHIFSWGSSIQAAISVYFVATGKCSNHGIVQYISRVWKAWSCERFTGARLGLLPVITFESVWSGINQGLARNRFSSWSLDLLDSPSGLSLAYVYLVPSEPYLYHKLASDVTWMHGNCPSFTTFIIVRLRPSSLWSHSNFSDQSCLSPTLCTRWGC